jgi:sensor histidine kinase YesM
MVFEYKINDENWKSLESTDRSINLASLSSGSYQIQFKLNNMLMKEDIRFTIKKPWYLQIWFIGLTLLSLISFGYFVYRRRIQVSNKENKVLLEKTKLEKDLRQSLLSSIKSQMNPHFLFNALNTIQSYIITEDKENASNYLSKFSKLTRKILRYE